MCDAEIAHPAHKEKKWTVTSHEIVGIMALVGLGMLRNLVGYLRYSVALKKVIKLLILLKDSS